MRKRRNQLSIFLLAVLLIMTVYYINANDINLIGVGKTVTNSTTTQSASIFKSMRDEIDQERNAKITALKAIINDSTKNAEEKANALAEVNKLEKLKTDEKNFESSIKNLGYTDVLVHIDGTNININVNSSAHTVKKANDIISLSKNTFGKGYNVTVYFQTR